MRCVVSVARRISIALVAVALFAVAAPLPASACAGASACPQMQGMAPGCPACPPRASVRAEMACCSPGAAPAAVPAAVQAGAERSLSPQPALGADLEIAPASRPDVAADAAVCSRAERRHEVGLNVLHAVFRI